MNISDAYSRRQFLTFAAAAGVAGLSGVPARASARYRRYNVASAQGQTMLGSYAKGIEAMLRLPPDHPQNWYRNAFIHLLDCPHGNWWFYVWHRGYLGYFERTIRALSGDENFALPYWDWTQSPQIPDAMFDGALSPTSGHYERYAADLATFTSFINPALSANWTSLSPVQRRQLDTRGYKAFDDLWNDVTGYDPKIKQGISGNEAFAPVCGSRFLSRQHPKLDDKTTSDVAAFIVIAGLLPTDFYNSANAELSFSSSKTASHNTAPGKTTAFSVLEGFPHNKVHNCIGGSGPLDPGPYGYMTNFLSPLDPVFFLHHANIDRLWDVWTRKQKRLHLPYLPTGNDLTALAEEPFLFFVDGDGKYVDGGKAGQYFSMDAFGYDYEPGFGEVVVQQPSATLSVTRAPQRIEGEVKNGIGTIPLPRVRVHALAGTAPAALLSVTIARPASSARDFDVLVDAPANLTHVGGNSPYYGGTISFFGPPMRGMRMSTEYTFVVPLRPTLEAFSARALERRTPVTIRIVPTNENLTAIPILKSLSLLSY